MNLFPWEQGEKPFWVNPENGLEWYVDKELTDWCNRENPQGWPALNAVVAYIAERDGDTVKAMGRVLIDRGTNGVLAFYTSVEAMASKIDVLRFQLSS